MKNHGINPTFSQMMKRNLFVLGIAIASSSVINAQYAPDAALDLNGCGYANLGNANATTAPSNVPAPGCASNNTGNADVLWNTYTVTVPTQLTVSGAGLPGALNDVGMAVYTFDGTNYILQACDDDSGVSLYPLIEINQDVSALAPDVNVPVGTILYISTWDYGNNNDGPYVVQTSDCATPTIYYVDNDGDGYGDENSPACDCAGTPPANSVTQGGDCNDNCDIIWEGLACDDGNPNTVGDVIVDPTCTCAGAIPVTNPCIPAGAENYTFTPATALTAPVIGSSVQICYSVNWGQVSGSWMDGIQFQLGPGFTNIVAGTAPADCGGGGGNWVFGTTINPTSGCALAITDDLSATNNIVGYYYDNGGTGNPGANWGDAGSCVFTACISATINSVNPADLTINTFASGDDYFGSYGVCGPCQPQAYSYPSAGTGTGPCNLQLSSCIVPSDCDQSTGLITIDQTNLNYATFYNAPATGNLIIEVNGVEEQSIPAPFVTSPMPLNFDTYAVGDGTNTLTVTAHFTDDPGCTATSNLVSPEACGCRVEVSAVDLTCSPINPDGYIVEFDLNNVNAIPNGSHVEISFDGSPGNDWESPAVTDPAADITLINTLPATFGTLTPLSTLVAAMSDGIGNYTVTVQDAAGVVNTNCTIVTPVPAVVNLPLVQLTAPVVTNCTSTALGSVFDVSFTAAMSGFDLMPGNNLLTFYNNGVPIDAIINGPPAPPYPAASNSIDLSTLTNGAADIVSIMFPGVQHNVLNSLSFTIENATGCVFNALVNDPSGNEFQFTLTTPPPPPAGATSPYEVSPCACAITNLQLQNATPECVGYGNFMQLGMSFSFENIPQGVPFVAYYTDVNSLSDLNMTTTPLPTPPVGYNVQDLFSYPDFSSNPVLCPSGVCPPIQNGTFPQQSASPSPTIWQTTITQLPIPPAAYATTEAHPGFLVVEFQYPAGTLQCTASIPFTIPGFCGCGPNVPAGTDDGSPFINLATPASNANPIALCPNEPALNFGFTPAGPLTGFRPPAIAHVPTSPTNSAPVASPYAPALALVLIDPNDPDKQIVWDYEMIDLTGATPSIANPLTIDNSYAIGGLYANQDLIHNLFNVNPLPDPEVMTAPLEVIARVITVYNMTNLLAAASNPTAPFLIPTSQIDNTNVALPYTGDIFMTGYNNFTQPDQTRCGAMSDDYTLVFPPIIHIDDIQWDCDAQTIAFDLYSGASSFDWSAPTLSSAPGPQPSPSNPNPLSNPVDNFTYDLTGMANGYVLDITIQDNYGCNQVQYPVLNATWGIPNPIQPDNLDNHVVFNPFVAKTQGQVFMAEIGGVNPVLLNSANQTVLCGRVPNAQDFNLIGGGVGYTGALSGTWTIDVPPPSPNYQLPSPVDTYYGQDPNIPDALIFNTGMISQDMVYNANDALQSPFVNPPYPLYFNIQFEPTITDPNGCSDPSDVYQIAFLDNYVPFAILPAVPPATVGGASAIEKCLNEPQFDLAVIGGMPTNGIWHIGPIDPVTGLGANDNIIENGSMFDLSNLPAANPAGIYQAYYDVSGVAGIQCPVMSTDFIEITINDTTDAVITPDILEDCMPMGEFVLTNSTVSIDPTIPCEWYVDDVLQPEDACDTLDLILMMPKLYDLALVSTDLNGCVDTTRYEDILEVHPQPEVAFLYNPQSVTMDDPEFQFIDDSDSPLVSYEWNFANYGSSTEPYTTFNFEEVTEPGSYDVTLTGWDANQCSTIVTRQVMIEEGFVVFMPTSFTPDDDNLNEALRPVISGADRIKFYNFVVFDRWGSVVFETNDYKEWWIGDNKAKSGYYVPNGAYQWRMEVILEGLEDRKVYKGSVTIMR